MLKQSIKDAKDSLKNSRINNKNQIKEELYEGKLMFDSFYEADLNERTVNIL